MKYHHNNHITNHFDLSIVLTQQCATALSQLPEKNLTYFQRNGIEVIVVLQEPPSAGAIPAFIHQYPFINWKIIYLPNGSQSPSPARARNCGIMNAAHQYVLLMDAAAVCSTDVVYRLMYICRAYTGSYAITANYSGLMARKEHLLAVGGYDELFYTEADMDRNLGARLNLYGIPARYVPDAVLLRDNTVCSLSGANSKQLKRVLYPNVLHAGNSHQPESVYEIIYSWQQNRYAHDLCARYLQQFRHYTITDPETLLQRKKIVALVQTYNEQEHILPLLQHLEGICDGVVLLDDGSEDNTYQMAQSHNLLLKVKKERQHFDDLYNRNILLRIAAFISADWFFFIDADERFDPQYSNLYSVAALPGIDTIGFFLVNLWDHETQYRTDMQDTHPVSRDGVMLRYRMFRNYGSMQLHANRTLHFPTVPYFRNTYMANILLRHYGVFDRKAREKKYQFYLQQDALFKEYDDRGAYHYLLDNDVKVKPLHDIKLPLL